jgi:hypothetical protein
VKCQVFLADGNDFAAMNEVYAEFSGAAKPTRATVVAPASVGITLVSRRITMRINSKGHGGDRARTREARRLPGEETRGRLLLEVLRGSADTRMSTDEILGLTRSEPGRAKGRRALH